MASLAVAVKVTVTAPSLTSPWAGSALRLTLRLPLAAGQPRASTAVPAWVSGHWSAASLTPSPSASRWLSAQPWASTAAPGGVPGQASSALRTRSPSLSPSSAEQPSASTGSIGPVLGQRSAGSSTPSPSPSITPPSVVVAQGRKLQVSHRRSSRSAVSGLSSMKGKALSA